MLALIINFFVMFWFKLCYFYVIIINLIKRSFLLFEIFFFFELLNKKEGTCNKANKIKFFL